MKSAEFKPSLPLSEEERDMELEPDYTKITASDLRRVLRGEENKVEDGLAVFTRYGRDSRKPPEFAFWGFRLPTDTELNRIRYSEDAQAHFQQLLNTVDEWDVKPTTPTGMPLHRPDPKDVYRGPHQR